MTQVTSVATHGYDSYETTDGSFIRYYGNQWPNWLLYPDGTRVELTGGSGTYNYPVKVSDSNGNYISINYVNGTGPRISSIQDTMGRYVRLHYDASNNLVAVTVPGYASGADRQAIRLYYEDVPLNQAGSFTGATISAPATARVVTHVFYPGTNTGYRFDYSPSYGMIRQIKELRGMSVSYAGLDQTGTITGDGQTAATTLYDYPLGPASLNGAPLYSQRCDDWAGRTEGMNGDPGQRPCFTFSDDQTTGVSAVTAPDGTVSVSSSLVSQNQTLNGLLAQTEVEHGLVTLAKSRIEWGTDADGVNQRPLKVFTTDEAGLTRAVVYTYTSYNNVASVSERDFTTDPHAVGAELRRTEMTYETGAGWINRRLLHLVTSVRVFAGGASAPASRAEYVYDTAGASLTRRDDVVMHEDASDPFAPDQQDCHWECFERPNGTCMMVWVCETTNPYDPATDKRGNLTQVKRYADAANGAGLIVDTLGYDITGNVMTETADCCQQRAYTYAKSCEYAYATQVARGNAGQLTTRATYDFNTGLVRELTDENNQTTTVGYDPATLRHFRTNRPDGGSTQSYFSDALSGDPDASRMHSYVSVTTAVAVGSATTSYRFLDGRGAVARTFHSYTPANGHVTADIEYDLMGRPLRASNPYYSSGSGSPITAPNGPWTTNAYDRLGRVASVTLPDGNVISSAFAGRKTTVTDQAGKQRRQIADALGRVRELHEPDAGGNLGPDTAPAQATSYAYDALDNLVKVTQGVQSRYFKYDSLGRLTHDRQVEQAAPHFAPDPLTGNNDWSSRIVYNSHGLITEAYDARNVGAQLTYDGLNRLTGVTHGRGGWDDAGRQLHI